MKFKEAIGTGASESFAEKYNQLVRAINNMEIKAPTAWGGYQPSVIISPNKITLDFTTSISTTGADPYYDDDQEQGGTSSGGGSSLPDGAKGDILYHNGTSWKSLTGINDSTVFAAMQLTISGTSGNSVPKWDYVRVSSSTGLVGG